MALWKGGGARKVKKLCVNLVERRSHLIKHKEEDSWKHDLWKHALCQQTSIEEMKRGLRKFLEKKCNVSDLKFLDKTQVTKLIVILNDMQKRKLKGAKREKH